MATILGSENQDVKNGGVANDTIRLFGDDDRGSGGGGNDRLYGDAGDDTLEGEVGNDRLFGGAGVDFLDGGDGNDTVDGAGGDDIAFGGAGNDSLFGSVGKDRLEGESGNDILRGGIGRDTLYGQGGSDRYVFDDGDSGAGILQRDVIRGFVRSEADRIDLRLIDANVNLADDQAFTYIGVVSEGADFTAAGQVRLVGLNIDGVVITDPNVTPFKYLVQMNTGATLLRDIEIAVEFVTGDPAAGWFLL